MIGDLMVSTKELGMYSMPGSYLRSLPSSTIMIVLWYGFSALSVFVMTFAGPGWVHGHHLLRLDDINV